MKEITAGWLLDILRAVPRQDRQHGHALEVVKAVSEQENAQLNLWFSAMIAVIAPILIAALSVLVSNVQGSAGAGSDVRAGLLLGVVTAGVAAMSVVFVAQHLLRERAARWYAESVALYFSLHRLEP